MCQASTQDGSAAGYECGSVTEVASRTKSIFIGRTYSPRLNSIKSAQRVPQFTQ